MTVRSAWPRQPFLGLAISATVGIVVADRWPDCSARIAVIIAAIAIVAWLTRRTLAVYALLGCGFFFLHSARTTDTPGLIAARSVGEGTRPVTVLGVVISEPRLSARGTAS